MLQAKPRVGAPYFEAGGHRLGNLRPASSGANLLLGGAQIGALMTEVLEFAVPAAECTFAARLDQDYVGSEAVEGPVPA